MTNQADATPEGTPEGLFDYDDFLRLKGSSIMHLYILTPPSSEIPPYLRTTFPVRPRPQPGSRRNRRVSGR